MYIMESKVHRYIIDTTVRQDYTRTEKNYPQRTEQNTSSFIHKVKLLKCSLKRCLINTQRECVSPSKWVRVYTHTLHFHILVRIWMACMCVCVYVRVTSTRNSCHSRPEEFAIVPYQLIIFPRSLPLYDSQVCVMYAARKTMETPPPPPPQLLFGASLCSVYTQRYKARSLSTVECTGLQRTPKHC